MEPVEDGGEGDGGEEVAVGFVEARGDGTEAFEALEEVLHVAALAALAPVIRDRGLAPTRGGMQWVFPVSLSRLW